MSVLIMAVQRHIVFPTALIRSSITFGLNTVTWSIVAVATFSTISSKIFRMCDD